MWMLQTHFQRISARHSVIKYFNVILIVTPSKNLQGVRSINTEYGLLIINPTANGSQTLVIGIVPGKARAQVKRDPQDSRPTPRVGGNEAARQLRQSLADLIRVPPRCVSGAADQPKQRSTSTDIPVSAGITTTRDRARTRQTQSAGVSLTFISSY